MQAPLHTCSPTGVLSAQRHSVHRPPVLHAFMREWKYRHTGRDAFHRCIQGAFQGLDTFVPLRIEWIRMGRPSLVGLCVGAIGGLATITPAAGFIEPSGASLGAVGQSWAWNAMEHHGMPWNDCCFNYLHDRALNGFCCDVGLNEAHMPESKI